MPEAIKVTFCLAFGLIGNVIYNHFDVFVKVYNVNVCAMLAFCGLKLEMSGLFAMSLTKHFVFNVL
ncbi:hypothetical protein BJL76_09805 [Vibrio parahaemolyticus]|nr:hypothetical protein ACX07_18850 [Vibrio parahaemolyticus]OOX44531.1 hypothetical protein BJL76_09805 [Vibrio parahaemolyticus]OOX59501.1 hypothetical protein BJL79_09725 [Vibrio parahaemolyticus]